MADTPKILGQLNPAATTTTDLYTVPTATKTITSLLVVCNQGAAGSFRVSVAEAGAALAAKQYIFYDMPIDANESFVRELVLTLSTTDKVRVYASHANMSFNLFGIEIT